MVVFHTACSLASQGGRVKRAKLDYGKINMEMLMFKIETDFQGIKGMAILDTGFCKVK